MPLKPDISAVVLLVGTDAAAVNFLRPAAEILASFGTDTATLELTANGQMPAISHEVCAIIVASTDAALPSALARQTNLPVIRVPMAGKDNGGLATLDDGSGNLPAGPTEGVFATMAIGEAGAKNAALFVISSLASTHAPMRAAWSEFRARQTEAVLRHPPLEPEH